MTDGPLERDGQEPHAVNTVAICAGFNRPGKSDASSVFGPAAEQWQKAHGGAIVRIDNRRLPHERAHEIVSALRAHTATPRPLEAFCYAGHGTKHSLPSAGVDMRDETLDALVGALLEGGATRDLRVMLMGCDTARDDDNDRFDDIAPGVGGEGGFADALRDKLTARGLTECEVYAHAIDGHATRCPYLRVFRAGAVGGEWVVAPHSPSWSRWKQLVGKLWPRLPWMTRAELEAELG